MNRLNVPFRAFALFNLALNTCKYVPIRIRVVAPAISFISFFTKKEKINLPTISDIIFDADGLFDNENYSAVYDLLLKYKDDQNPEIIWRICRVLYKLAKTEEYNEKASKEMIHEAYEIISKSLTLNTENADLHKWMAIILDAKLRFEKTRFKMKENIEVKNHLMEANNLNPNDYTVLYMLGQWHYKMSDMSWFQRKLTQILFDDPPDSNYEQALYYFLKAEEIKPRYYLNNMYMLGKINFQMGNMYRAHYYLKIATQMSPSTEQEEQCVSAARKLVKRLKDFDMSEDAL